MYDCFNCSVGGGNQWQGLLSNLEALLVLTHASYASPGGWNDMDMMEMCNGGMTLTEYQSHFSIWSILTSPLILGNDVRHIPPECFALISNKEVIAVNQDELGVQGRLVFQSIDKFSQIYVKPLANHGFAVVLFNMGPNATSITLTWGMLDVGFSTTFLIRDIWKHTDLGKFQASFSSQVMSHGTVMVTLMPLL